MTRTTNEPGEAERAELDRMMDGLDREDFAVLDRMTDPTPEQIEAQKRADEMARERLQAMHDSLIVYTEGPFESWPQPQTIEDRWYGQGSK